MKTKFIIVLAAIAAMLCVMPAAAKSAKNAKNATVTVEQIMADRDAYVGKTITLTGYCTHLCPHGGKKMFLAANADSKAQLRAEAGEIGAFSKDCIKHKVEVTGEWVEKRIDEAYIQKLLAANSDDKCSGCGDAAVKKQADAYRARIAAIKEKTGKDYISQYYFAATSYKIAE